jgi:hypothetical protein
MRTSLALVGLAAVAFVAGCAHECRCVCLDGTSRTVSAEGPIGRSRSVPGSYRRFRTSQSLTRYSSPWAGLSAGDRRAQPRPKPWSYPDPFEPDPFEPADSDACKVAAGRHFDNAETLEEADVVATARACSERIQREAEATARTEELQRQLRQITRP